jgi:arsenate reductase
MADVIIFHNPNCSSSRHAVETATGLGVDFTERRYLNKAEAPSREEILGLLEILEDPAADLVRRDANFEKLGLSDADVASPEQIAEVIAANPELLQRPLIVRDGAAIIGRPKDRVAPFLS